MQQQAITAAGAEGGIGGYQPLLTTGADTLATGLTTLGQAQDPIGAAQESIVGTGQLFAPSDLTAYTNPYQQQVIDNTLAELNRQSAIAQNRLATQAQRAGAFGGSRFGIQSAELDRNLADSQARALAQLNAQNYNQALQTAQTAFENQQRRQQNQAQLYGGIASLYGNLGAQQAGIGGQQLGAAQAMQQMGVKDLGVLQNLGAQQQAQEQAQLDATRANEQAQLYEPYSRLAFLSDIYKGAPSTQTVLGSQVSPSAPTPSAFQQVAGGGTGLLGTAAAAKQLGGLF